jgi:hypothetical protein
MKRFTVITALFSIGLLAAWAIFQPFSAAASENDNTLRNEEVDARTVAPVFDANGAVTSDPSGTLLNTIRTGAEVKIAPVYDATGALVSDPNGTISSVIHSGDMLVPVTGATLKIAPVFDATGAVVSDPTGTLWNTVNP